MKAAIADPNPVVLLENELMYGKEFDMSDEALSEVCVCVCVCVCIPPSLLITHALLAELHCPHRQGQD